MAPATRKRKLTEQSALRPTKKRGAGAAQALQNDNLNEGSAGDGQENVSEPFLL